MDAGKSELKDVWKYVYFEIRQCGECSAINHLQKKTCENKKFRLIRTHAFKG